MGNLSEGLSAESGPALQPTLPKQRPLGVTLIVLYFILVTLVELVLLFVPFLRPTGYTLPGGPSTLYFPQVTIPLTLFVAWGLWHCYAWARTIIICIGILTIPLSLLGGTEGFKTWILLAIVLYLFQRRIGDIFSPTPTPQR